MNVTDILSMSGEPAVLLRQGKVAYANGGALRLFGTDCIGSPAEELIGPELSRFPARSFLASFEIKGASYILRTNRLEEGRLVFFQKQQEALLIINDAFLYNLRCNLMTLGVAADKLRPAVEDAGFTALRGDLMALTAGYFKLMRLSENASFVHSVLSHSPVVLPVTLDLSLLCQAVLDTVEESFPGLELVREIPAGVQAVADPRLIRQLLFNLLSNCLCHAHAAFVQVKLMETPGSIVLAVSDNGVGIPVDALPTVFERYRRDYTLGELKGGAGLGLTTALEIARLHGGTLLLESREGQGTSVRASFSRHTAPIRLGMSQELCPVREVLVGLADCLPLEAFDMKYMD